MFRISCVCLALCFLIFPIGAAASPAPWTFNPPTAGRALQSGGWMVEYRLGSINASPEFSFPLQLIYLTTRTQEGLFGHGWFSPQLESSLIPVGKGALVWTMPSGGQMLLQENPDDLGDYRSADHVWKAELSPVLQKISNEDGWEYQFSKGKLIAVLSPGHRILEFDWRGTQLEGIQVRDLASNNRRVLLVAVYGANKRIAGFKLDGQPHKFAYLQDGTAERLSAWSPPAGEMAQFLYQRDSGILIKTGVGNTNDPGRIEEFKTQFVNPGADGTAAGVILARKKMENYWLIEDRNCSYAYGRLGKDQKQWDPSDITVTWRTGLVQKMTYAEQRGIVTSRQDGVERKSYYYRAPGQKYDGKLRRIEENGNLTAEYRYDRKTGLLTETVDAGGVITFYDYDPAFRPSRLVAWEPKPLRVRRGSRVKSEIVAEYAYSDDGKLIGVKDSHGNLTRYTYTARGEIASVTNPAGDTVSYSYDGFGRCNAVSSVGRTERMEYDENGRVKAQLAADGSKTEMIYDADGQLSQVKKNGKVTKELVRDEFHRVTGEKDSLNRLSRIERDARGNVTAQIAPNGAATRYEYDAVDRRIAQIDGNGNKINFTYDPAGHLIKQVNPLGNVLTWQYDPRTGQNTGRTNGEQTIQQTYTKDGALSYIDYGSGQRLYYTYNKEGRPLKATSSEATFEYSYDAEGLPIATHAVCGLDDYLLGYRYNKRGQRTGLLFSKLAVLSENSTGYEVLQQTEQSYDPAGRLSCIVSNGIPAISYRYDLAGRPVQKTYGLPKNGKPALTADIGYDATGHLARMDFKGGSLTSPLSLIYEWDDADQLTRRTWNGRTLRYEYDGSGQLLKVIDDRDQSLVEAYTYDAAGNMLTKLLHGQLTVMTYNPGNQLAKSYDLGPADIQSVASLPKSETGLASRAKSSLSYRYDRAGRMLGNGTESANSYGWLDKIISTILPGGAKATYSYWPDGQLAAISSPSSISNPRSSSESFLWDGLALLKRNDTLYIIEPHPSGGVPIASHPVGKPDEITWHLNDLLGSTLATVGPEGVCFSNLTSFGQPLKSTSGEASMGTAGPSAPANPVPTNNQLPPAKR